MTITDKKAIEYVLDKVIRSIIGHCADISNYSEHKYPFDFSEKGVFNDKDKVDKHLKEISLLLKNFGPYMDLNNFLDDFFTKNPDNHWSRRKEDFKMYIIKECIPSIRDQIINTIYDNKE